MSGRPSWCRSTSEVELVHEQDPAERTGDQFIGLRSRRADVLAAEIGAFDLDDLGVPDDAQAGIDLAERLGGRRLTGAGWTDQEHVVGLVVHRQPVRQSQCADLDLVLELGHRTFDLAQARPGC